VTHRRPQTQIPEDCHDQNFPAAALSVSATLTPADAQEVSLFAAGNLKAALTQIAQDFTATTGTAVVTRFGPSGLMREQIEAGNGGPVALFARDRLCALARPDVAVTTDTLLEVMLDDGIRLGTSTPRPTRRAITPLRFSTRAGMRTLSRPRRCN
jgi:molybdate transport system substrate-binding protein